MAKGDETAEVEPTAAERQVAGRAAATAEGRPGVGWGWAR